MKCSLAWIVALFALCAGHFARADDDDGPSKGQAGSSASETKAVLDYSKEQGFRLSEPALRTLNLKMATVRSKEGGLFEIPTSSAVYYQDEVGVYRLRKGWFRMVEVKVFSKTKDALVVKTRGLQPGEEIVVQGVPLLRVADLGASGGLRDPD